MEQSGQDHVDSPLVVPNTRAKLGQLPVVPFANHGQELVLLLTGSEMVIRSIIIVGTRIQVSSMMESGVTDYPTINPKGAISQCVVSRTEFIFNFNHSTLAESDWKDGLDFIDDSKPYAAINKSPSGDGWDWNTESLNARAAPVCKLEVNSCKFCWLIFLR